MEQAVIEPGTLDIDAFGQDEGALELPGGDAAMDENSAITIIALAAADDELVVFLGDMQVIHRETGDGEGDAQPAIARLFDVVGGVPFGILLDPVEHLLEMVKAQEERRTEDRRT